MPSSGGSHAPARSHAPFRRFRLFRRLRHDRDRRGFVGGRLEADTYPLWPESMLPGGPPADLRQLPHPATTATAISPNYLITTMVGMPEAVVKFQAPNGVYLYDRGRWIAGRYVDRITGENFALVRVEQSLPFTKLARGSKDVMSLSGIAAGSRGQGSFEREMTLASSCPGHILKFLAAKTGISRLSLCATTRGPRLNEGAVFLDRNGDIVGLAILGIPGMPAAGIDADEIRHLLANYFATGGRDATGKPDL